MTKIIGDYGMMFQLLRRESGVRQRELDGSGITTQTVSRFENQRSDLALQSVLGLLSEMPLTLHEYMITSTKGFPSNFDEFVHFVGSLGITTEGDDSIAGVALSYRILYAATGKLAWRLRATMLVGSQDTLLNIQERRAVQEYLLCVREWSAYEFILFRRALDTGVLTIKEVPVLWNKMRRFNQDARRANYTTQRRQMQTLLVVAKMYLEVGEYESVREILAVVRKLPARVGDIDHDFTLRTLEAEYLLRAPDQDWYAGRDLLHELILSAEYLDAPQVAERLIKISVENVTNFRKVRQNA